MKLEGLGEGEEVEEDLEVLLVEIDKVLLERIPWIIMILMGLSKKIVLHRFGYEDYFLTKLI